MKICQNIRNYIYYTYIEKNLDLDNLEAAPGRTAPEFQVGTLKMVVFTFKLYFLHGKKHK